MRARASALRVVAVATLTLAVGPLALAQDCDLVNPPMTALTELAPDLYQGYQGGLYPSESNVMPHAHLQMGKFQASRVVPRDALGDPDCETGRIGVLSMGMSVTRQVFGGWREIYSDFDPGRNPAVMLVDGTAGGQASEQWADGFTVNGFDIWESVQERVSASGLSPLQIQVAYIYMGAPYIDAFPQNALKYQEDLRIIVQSLRDEFPNCRVAYISTMYWLGFSTSDKPGRQEPFGYENGFGVKWAIEDQINGDPDLDPIAGNAPWMGWGPYFWANKTEDPEALWNCEDYSDDVHLSEQGKLKVAAMMDEFFNSDPTAVKWYPIQPGCEPTPVSLATRYGTGCEWNNGIVPRIETDMCGPPCGDFIPNSLPFLGNAGLRIKVVQPGGAGRPAIGMLSLGKVPALEGECAVHIDWGLVFASITVNMNFNGVGVLPLPVPTNPALIGMRFYGQWYTPALGGGGELAVGFEEYGASRGMDFRIGP